MSERVIIQDIADALGVSRNTVSKAINNTGLLADSTREKVLNKAREMGYKQFSYRNTTNFAGTESPSALTGAGEIVLFTTGFTGELHFSATMLDKFQHEISLLGYSFSMHRIQDDEIDNLRLPGSYHKEKTSGIICIEIFDKRYCSMLCRLDNPILFVDSPVFGCDEPLKADYLYMDNRSGIRSFVAEMVRRGKERIGFIGEYMHCQSFYERYMEYRNAMYLSGLSCPEGYCLLGNKGGVKRPGSAEYQEYLARAFRSMEKLPDVFICANDFVAIDVLTVFRKMGISVPQDVWLCGFDDSPQSKIITPSLTTIHIHNRIMGLSAVQLLVSRIKDPTLNMRMIYTETSLIYRESTGD